MNWGTPSWLFVLLAIPVLAACFVFAWRRRVRISNTLGSVRSTSLIVGETRGLRAARAVVFLLGLALLGVALARPQFGARTEMLRKRGVDIVVALDFSKSMLARDVRPSRIDRAKAELLRLLGELDGDRVGIVAFAGETMQFPMTVDPSAAELFFRDLGPYDMPVGGTAIGRALTASLDLLTRSQPESTGANATQRSRVVLLFTDGEDHEGDPVAAARALAEAGVHVYVVGIGTRTGEPIPSYAPDGTWTGYMRGEDGQPILTSLSAEAEATLREIASTTGGKYFHAPRGSVGVDEIRAELRKLKQDELRARRITIHEERYALVLALAIALLSVETLMPESFIRRRKRDTKEAA